MKKGIIGKKIGMTQIFDESGKVVPVTVVEVGPCTVVQKKTVQNDGYDAVQLGYGDAKANKVNKPMKGHFDKADVAPKKSLREFRFDVCGVSKGKGYQGAIKRHGQKTLRHTHGTGPVGRQPGSMGAISDPSRIFKGKGMAGHMGSEQVTVQNLEVVKVDVENNLIAVKGAIPGPKGGLVVLTDSKKA